MPVRVGSSEGLGGSVCIAPSAPGEYDKGQAEAYELPVVLRGKLPRDDNGHVWVSGIHTNLQCRTNWVLCNCAFGVRFGLAGR